MIGGLRLPNYELLRSEVTSVARSVSMADFTCVPAIGATIRF